MTAEPSWFHPRRDMFITKRITKQDAAEVRVRIPDMLVNWSTHPLPSDVNQDVARGVRPRPREILGNRTPLPETPLDGVGIGNPA